MKPNFDFPSLGREVKLEQTLWQAWESFNLLGSLGDADGGGDLDKAARFQLKQQIQNYKQESSILISCNQGCISCGILLSGTWARGVSS